MLQDIGYGTDATSRLDMANKIEAAFNELRFALETAAQFMAERAATNVHKVYDVAHIVDYANKLGSIERNVCAIVNNPY